MPPASSSGSFFTKKVGGVPVWGIGLVVVGVVGYMYWRSKKAASAAAAITSSTASGTSATTPAVTPASDYGAPTGFSFAGGGGTPPWAQPVPVATTPATPTPSTTQSQLGSGYGILNSQFPSQGVLSVPTSQGTFTELNSSGNTAFGGQAATGTAGNYYQPTPGVFTPITAGDTLSPGTPIFGLTPAAAATS